jgi:hypothetical protein
VLLNSAVDRSGYFQPKLAECYFSNRFNNIHFARNEMKPEKKKKKSVPGRKKQANEVLMERLRDPEQGCAK